METQLKHTEPFNYILTFIAVVVLIGCFATQIITGTEPIIAMDSLAGSVLIGFFLLLYLCWFIYDTAAYSNIGLKESAAATLSRNPAAWCIYAFWIVFILVPLVINS
jgi:biotin transporter BioY